VCTSYITLSVLPYVRENCFLHPVACALIQAAADQNSVQNYVRVNLLNGTRCLHFRYAIVSRKTMPSAGCRLRWRWWKASLWSSTMPRQHIRWRTSLTSTSFDCRAKSECPSATTFDANEYIVFGGSFAVAFEIVIQNRLAVDLWAD